MGLWYFGCDEESLVLISIAADGDMMFTFTIGSYSLSIRSSLSLSLCLFVFFFARSDSVFSSFGRFGLVNEGPGDELLSYVRYCPSLPLGYPSAYGSQILCIAMSLVLQIGISFATSSNRKDSNVVLFWGWSREDPSREVCALHGWGLSNKSLSSHRKEQRPWIRGCVIGLWFHYICSHGYIFLDIARSLSSGVYEWSNWWLLLPARASSKRGTYRWTAFPRAVQTKFALGKNHAIWLPILQKPNFFVRRISFATLASRSTCHPGRSILHLVIDFYSFAILGCVFCGDQVIRDSISSVINKITVLIWRYKCKHQWRNLRR